MNTWTRFTTWKDRRGSFGPRSRQFFAAVIAAAVSLPVLADNTQPLDEIEEAVEAHVQANLPDSGKSTVEIGRVDSRLRLAKCTEPLQTFDPPGRGSQSRSTVGVRCETPSPWTLYVSARIQTVKEVYAASRTMRRGTLLSEDDLRRQEVDVNRASRGYYTDPEQLVGMEVRRPMREGEVITPTRIDAPQLVERGQTVLITAEGPASNISMNGEALQAGALGDRIRVRNVSSERVIEGEIVGDSRVMVGY